MKNNAVIRHFSPMWFAVSMGMGGFANLLYQLGSNSEFLKVSGIIIAIINVMVFVIFLGPWILRWFIHNDKISEDWKHPITSNFFITMPVALVLIATHLLMMGAAIFGISSSMTISLVLWVIGMILALLFSVYTTFNMMLHETIHPMMTNFSWFVSPVASIIVPLLGNSLVKYYALSNTPLAEFINIMDIAFYGIGFLLFIILSSIVFNRFLFHKLPGSAVLPSFWILLGPIGLGTVSLMGLAEANVLLGWIYTVQFINFLAIILWGFGIWAFSLLVMITGMYMKDGSIPFSLSWWAFIFPLDAYSLATLSVYKYTNILAIKYFALLLTILLSTLFIVTFIKTLLGVIKKELLFSQNK
jgi:C4-dicarboxylate transporter/malic acid transport protein